jgi:rsbT co-antagonist protein RsbR
MNVSLSTTHAAQAAQRARFGYFLKWMLGALGISGLVYGVVATIFASLLAGLVALICLGGLGIGLIAWRQLARERLTTAVILCIATLLIGSILIVISLPALYPSDALVPLLAVTIALPYLRGRTMFMLILICIGVSAVITVLGTYVDLLQLALPPFLALLLINNYVVSIALICLLLWQFGNRLNEAVAQAETANAQLESTNANLAEVNQQLNTQLNQLRQLLELVTTLETPTVPLAEGVIFVPIVGHVDTRRAQDLNQRLLTATSVQHARMVILDIAGVSLMDTSIAQALLQTAQALRLLGCQVTLSGISSANALTLSRLGVDLRGVATVRSPQEAIARWAGEQDTLAFEN